MWGGRLCRLPYKSQQKVDVGCLIFFCGGLMTRLKIEVWSEGLDLGVEPVKEGSFPGE